MNLDEIIALLENLGIPPVALEHYAKHRNPIVRAMVAEHPGTPRETLLDLACDPSRFVRCAVVRNPNACECVWVLASHHPADW